MKTFQGVKNSKLESILAFCAFRTFRLDRNAEALTFITRSGLPKSCFLSKGASCFLLIFCARAPSDLFFAFGLTMESPQPTHHF
jgi:hypothetical protein